MTAELKDVDTVGDLREALVGLPDNMPLDGWYDSHCGHAPSISVGVEEGVLEVVFNS